MSDISYEEVLKSVSFNADDSLAMYTGVPNTVGAASPNYGKQYSFVKLTGRNTVGLATNATDAVVGVVQNKPQVKGQAATVALYGITNVVAGAAFSAGDKLSLNSDGHAIKATGDSFVAIAVDDASGAKALAPALLRCN